MKAIFDHRLVFTFWNYMGVWAAGAAAGIGCYRADFYLMALGGIIGICAILMTEDARQ